MSRARVAGVVLLLAVAASCFTPAAASASEVSASEFRALAREATDDASSLAELRDVDTVDGRAVDVAGALGGARGEELDARLRELAAPEVAAPAGDPRAQAREVLSERRFQGTEVPGPFEGVFDWLDDVLPSLDGVLEFLDGLLPGGRSVVWIVLGALFAGAGWVVARKVLTRRVRASTAATRSAVAARDEDPRTLDRRADAAEAAGDLETALRLRFRAGLLRLDARGAIHFRPSISTHEVRRTLRSNDFDTLASTFDDVVYGGREPQPDDLAAARDRWPLVVKENVKGTVPFRES